MRKKYPALVQSMENRHEVYNRTLNDLIEMEKRGEVYIIQPKEPIKIRRTEKNPKKLKALYDTGYQEGLRHLESLKKFIETD